MIPIGVEGHCLQTNYNYHKQTDLEGQSTNKAHYHKYISTTV